MKSHLWLTNTIILSLLHDVSSSSLTAWTMLSVGPPPPLYETCVQALKDALIPGNPPFIRPVPRHSDPNDGLFKNTRMVQVDDSPSAHLLAALNVALPSTTATFAPLSPHIQAAIRFALAQGSSLTNWRERQNHILTTVSEALEPLTFTINNSIKRPFNVQLIASQVHIALLACISDALNWPDSGLAVGMLTGFPVVGIIPDSGVYRPTQPALPPPRFNDDFMEFTDSNDSWNRHLEYRLRAQAAGSTPDDIIMLDALDDTTQKEVDKGLISPSMSRHELDKLFGVGEWRAMPRFGVRQGEKIRAIDDAASSGHNTATFTYETISLPTVEFPVHVATYVLHVCESTGIEIPPLMLALDDIDAAYRRVPTSQPQYTVCAFYSRRLFPSISCTAITSV